MDVELSQLNKMEREMLVEGLDFNAYVEEEEYLRFACLVSRVGCKNKNEDESDSPKKQTQNNKQTQKHSKAIAKPHSKNL